jgi:hypothetical protein
MFCGKPAETREHILPQWMHREFGIKHQKLVLRNETQIRYMHEVLPACKECNTRFSKIESRVHSRTASPQDLYVWALKIYRGLNLKDTFLPESRRKPARGSLLTPGESVQGVEFAPHILSSYGKHGFTTYPSPFGSVIQVAVPPVVEPGFALASIGYPHNVITVSVSPTSLLTAVLNDKGLVNRAIREKKLPDHSAVTYTAEYSARHNNAVMTAHTYGRFLTLHYCRLKARLAIPRGQAIRPNRVAAVRLPTALSVRAAEDPQLIGWIMTKLFSLEFSQQTPSSSYS